MNYNSRKVWDQPWGYKEGFIFAAGILLAGVLLQLTTGNFELYLFAFPVNTILGALFILGLLLVYFLLKRNKTIKWVSSVYTAIPSIILLIFLSVIMGIVPQFAESTDTSQFALNFILKLGWHKMTTSWPFVLACFYLLFILGLSTLRRTSKKQTWRDIGFYLNHLGLFIALLGGLIGSADLTRLTMSVSEGQVEWRGSDRSGRIRDLSIAVQLDSFKIEEYEPRLVVIETANGRMLPISKPDNYMFEKVGKTIQLAGFTVEITDYLPNAAIFTDSTFMNIVPMKMDGAATAIKARVTKSGSELFSEGWVSNGSYMFPHILLEIDKNTSLAMPPQEVKKYSSHVTVFTEKGITKKGLIEVNKPLRVEDWMIYQYSYDDNKGKYSDTSTFELVSDPWLKVVHSGNLMLMVGSLFLFFAGPKKDNPNKKELL